MVEKEILMHLIAYNTVRSLMVDSVKTIDQLPRKISFKASVQALRQWEPQLNQTGLSDLERRRLMSLLIEAIAATILAQRPGRREPRPVKRRPKPFALMSAPRHQFIEIPHRGRYPAKQA
jgi:hypothetical protein